MPSLEDLKIVSDYLGREWRVIARAPITFVGSIAIFGIIVGYLEWETIERHYVTRLAEMATANSRLDATIRSLQATIQYQDARISELNGKRAVASIAGSSGLKFENIDIIENTDPLAINVVYKNVGALPALGAFHAYTAVFPDGLLTDDEIENFFHVASEGMKDAEQQRIASEIQPGEKIFFTIRTPISRKVFDSSSNGKGVMYVLAISKYRDRKTPPDKWRLTEVCVFVWKDQAPHVCAQHHRMVLSD